MDYVLRLTRTPGAMREQDVQSLRAVGLDDQAVVQVAGIASFFNYVNRMADALGVGRG